MIDRRHFLWGLSGSGLAASAAGGLWLAWPGPQVRLSQAQTLAIRLNQIDKNHTMARMEKYFALHQALVESGLTGTDLEKVTRLGLGVSPYDLYKNIQTYFVHQVETPLRSSLVTACIQVNPHLTAQRWAWVQRYYQTIAPEIIK